MHVKHYPGPNHSWLVAYLCQQIIKSACTGRWKKWGRSPLFCRYIRVQKTTATLRHFGGPVLISLLIYFPKMPGKRQSWSNGIVRFTVASCRPLLVLEVFWGDRNWRKTLLLIPSVLDDAPQNPCKSHTGVWLKILAFKRQTSPKMSVLCGVFEVQKLIAKYVGFDS